MENVYSQLTEEAIKSLNEAADALGIEIPEIKVLAQKFNFIKPSNIRDISDVSNLSSKTRGEVRKTSPKTVVTLTEYDRLDSETQSLLEFDALARYKQEKELETKISEENKMNALVEEISRNIAKRIEEEEGKKITSARGRVSKTYDKDDYMERFTEPKKRLFLTRLIHGRAYDKGWYDRLEEDINDGIITQETVNESKESGTFIGRHLYRKVQNYEDAAEDVTVEKQWLAFKIGLATVLLVGTMGLAHVAANEMQEWQEMRAEANRIVTIDNARENERLQAQSIIMQIAEQTDYKFENLSSKQQLDAVLRIPAILNKYSEARFRSAMIRLQDQELLEEIMKKTYGAEFSEFTPEQLMDLKQLTYELIDDENKKMYIRNPQIVKSKQLEQKSQEDREIGE